MRVDSSSQPAGRRISTIPPSTRKKDGGGRSPQLGMRKSCDGCRRIKRKCEGGTPCRRCADDGNGNQCTYSRRGSQDRRRRLPHREDGLDEMQTDVLVHTSSGTFRGTMTFKRPRLSPSPATGLVGMQENAFLGDFFSCIGFYPLTTKRTIRQTLVNIMSSSATRQPADSVLHWAEGNGTGATETETSGGIVLTGSQLPMDPSTCIFWCAVALGALVKGVPAESVAKYCKLARDSLQGCGNAASVEMAMAWTNLGYLYGLLGNMARFQEYLERTSTFMASSSGKVSAHMLPTGFAEIVEHKETVRVVSGSADPGQIESFCTRQYDPPQIMKAADEWEVCRYVTKSYMIFQQANHARAHKEHPASARGKGVLRNGGGKAPAVISTHVEASPSDQVADAMATGLQDNVMDFDILEEAVERTLAFTKAAMGDVCATVDHMGRCVEVFELYPGLCRYTMVWGHVAHFVVAALAATDDAEARSLYQRLMEVYNPHRPTGSLPIPPLEEWKGMPSICDGFQCRMTERTLASSAMSVFSASLGPEEVPYKPDTSPSYIEQIQSEPVGAGIPSVMTGWKSLASRTMKSGRVIAQPDVDAQPLLGVPSCVLPFRSQITAKTGMISFNTTDIGHGEGLFAGLVPSSTPLARTRSAGTDRLACDFLDDDITAADWSEVFTAVWDADDHAYLASG